MLGSPNTELLASPPIPRVIPARESRAGGAVWRTIDCTVRPGCIIRPMVSESCPLSSTRRRIAKPPRPGLCSTTLRRARRRGTRCRFAALYQARQLSHDRFRGSAGGGMIKSQLIASLAEEKSASHSARHRPCRRRDFRERHPCPGGGRAGRVARLRSFFSARALSPARPEPQDRSGGSGARQVRAVFQEWQGASREAQRRVTAPF